MYNERVMAFVALVVASASLAHAGLLQSLNQALGIQNCANKCDKVFDRQQYAISDQPGRDTFEFRSCIIGCNQCGRILTNQNAVDPTSNVMAAEGDAEYEDAPWVAPADVAAAPEDANLTTGDSAFASSQQGPSCFDYCKRFNYGGQGIRKGLIEPDKACLMGCVINTCQQVCTGGTTDDSITDENRQYWWGQGGKGCSIKSGGGYVQNPNYGNPNAPGGYGARQDLKGCCTNAFNLCYYNGDKSTVNYQKVQLVARRSCRAFVAQNRNNTAICEFYNTPRNCGTGGMGGASNP